MDPETTSSASCRIVVVSPSLETSREVARRIKALSGDTSESPTSPEVIHWTIKNKYYIAPVHFHPIHLEGLEFIELDGVPAVIYVWNGNEPYRSHVKQVAEQTTPYNPEVSLAISLTPTTDEQLEDFFFEHGFEYIEGHTDTQNRLTDDPSGIPGMHRAVDALSTIMWPSMVRTDSKAPALTKQATLDPGSEEEDEVDLDYRTLMNSGGDDGNSTLAREMEIFEKWLEEDDGNYKESSVGVDDNDGYASLDSHVQSNSNDPWSTTTPSAKTNVEGFDDDFADFVSAPNISSRTGQKADSDSDTDLPSEADIRAASTRIFGPTTGASRSAEPESSHADLERNISELDMGSPAFDLTRILGALDTMKDEILKIPDMRERRRAAAEAALGLVYGLEETNEEVDATARAR